MSGPGEGPEMGPGAPKRRKNIKKYGLAPLGLVTLVAFMPFLGCQGLSEAAPAASLTCLHVQSLQVRTVLLAPARPSVAQLG